MSFEDWVAQNLAATMLTFPWTPDQLAGCLRRYCMPNSGLQQSQLLEDLVRDFPKGGTPSLAELTDFLLARQSFYDATAYYWDEPQDLPTCLEAPLFAPVLPLRGLGIPELRTVGDVAGWLGLTDSELDWFADTRRQHDTTRIPDLLHYTFHVIPKRNGRARFIEAPKARLKTIQRKILREILRNVPPHDAAHGYVAKRSCLTAARKHAGEAVVITADLVDFFPKTRLSRVHRIFRSLGYPPHVARCLTDLTSTSTPGHVLPNEPTCPRQSWRTREVFRNRHLPQGAPTSPALANLAAWVLDVRLTRFAARFDANYTRYSDDLAFSGCDRLERQRRGFLAGMQEIIADSGYLVNQAKTRIMRQENRQRITGVVVNKHVNVNRADFDRLKAILNNCVRDGIDHHNRDGHQNFRAHLEGRVTWVENVNSARGAKLRRIFDAISW